MADFDWAGLANTLNNLYGSYNSNNIAGNVNENVQSQLNQNQQAGQSVIGSLVNQIANGQGISQDVYNQAKNDVATQNGQLQGTIGTMTNNLNALNSPDSPYMQMARQAIERKDAAAGRRSQWGDREVQLAGTLADYVGKYAPALNNSITSASNQINLNNQGLASLYANITTPADRNTANLTNMLNQQTQNATAQATTGAAAANTANNSQTALIGQGISGLGSLASGLGSLFGGSSGGNTSGWNPAYSVSGWDPYGQMGNYFGSAGSTSLAPGLGDWNSNPYGYTSSIGNDAFSNWSFT